MGAFEAWLNRLLTPIITAAVTAAVKEAFAAAKDTAEVGKPNEDLQDSWRYDGPEPHL